MSIEESHIMLSQDGELFTPTNYIYIQPHTNRDGEREYELKIDAGLCYLLNSVFLLWESIKEESADLSDQDLYELCDDFDLNYDLFKRQMRGDL